MKQFFVPFIFLTLILSSCHSSDQATASSKNSLNSKLDSEQIDRIPAEDDSNESNWNGHDDFEENSELSTETADNNSEAASETNALHDGNKNTLANSNKGPCENDNKTFRCIKFIKNYDGDTITVTIPNTHPLFGKNIPVRVFGVDAPEIKTKDKCEKEAGRMAKNLVTSLLKNAKNIEIRNVKRDKYFRVLGEVYSDGINIKDVLIKNQLAYEYYGKTKKKINWCQVVKQNNLSF